MCPVVNIWIKHTIKYFYFLLQNTSRDLLKLVKSAGFEEILAQSLVKRSKTKVKGASRQATEVINISQPDPAFNFSAELLSPAVVAILKAVLTAGLYPHLARVSFVQPVDHAANPKKEVCLAQTPQGPAQAHPTSVNRFLGANGWLAYLEKVILTFWQ